MSAASARAVASLLRLAAAAQRDAAVLADRGRVATAMAIIAEAAGRVVQAVAASEAGWPTDAGLAAIPDDNPLRESLAALLQACPSPPSPVRPNGLPSPEPDPKALQRGLDQSAAALALAAGQFAVDLAGEGPAGRDAPLRRPPKPPDPPPAPKPTAPTRIVLRAASSPAPAPTRPVPPSVPITPPAPPGNLSSSGFWALMDGWGVDDQTALSLLHHEGGLTKKGIRPRFKLDAAEADRFAFLREIDCSLRSLGLDARIWLVTPTASQPFGGQTPLAFLAAGGAARDVNRFILQQGLRLSMGKPARPH